jgi:hypothetical protein
MSHIGEDTCKIPTVKYSASVLQDGTFDWVDTLIQNGPTGRLACIRLLVVLGRYHARIFHLASRYLVS